MKRLFSMVLVVSVCMGGVIANAIFDAVGARLRRLPMTPARVKEAAQKA